MTLKNEEKNKKLEKQIYHMAEQNINQNKNI